MRRSLAVGLSVLWFLTACGRGEGGPVISPRSPRASGTIPVSPVPTTPHPSPTPRIGTRVHLETVARLDEPIALAVRPGDPSLYVAEKPGLVVSLRPGTRSAPRTVLDLTGNITTGSEQGLLGITFSPDGRWLYASFTDGNGDSNVVAYAFSGGRARRPGRRILFVAQPFSNHNGGNIVFGPDGMLYLGLGDGGSEGDPDDRGQDLRTLLAKMLRIDPTPAGPNQYAVPASNPFVGRAGVRPEIWAYGLRNPWRFSFDRSTGDLWIGDVGQNAWEEIDEQPADSHGGQNYGWSCFEGDHRYKDCRPRVAVRPVYEYSHGSGGCAVTGGYVYRGTDIPGLRGASVFGDYCDGRLFGLVRTGDGVRVWRLGPTVSGLDSFGEDPSGELYAMSLNGSLYRLTP